MFFRKKRDEVTDNTKESVSGQVVIDGETAIKPYYYLRNGLLHARFTVDRCVRLTEDEENRIKAELSSRPYLKQDILSNNWDFLTHFVDKRIINDGVNEGYKRSQELAQKYRTEHGYKNQGSNIR